MAEALTISEQYVLNNILLQFGEATMKGKPDFSLLEALAAKAEAKLAETGKSDSGYNRKIGDMHEELQQMRDSKYYT